MQDFKITANTFADGEIAFFNLKIDGIDQFAKFEEDLIQTELSQFKTLCSRIELLSNKRLLPQQQHRKLQGFDNIYEIKTKDLRLYYCTIKHHSRVICLGGIKKNQPKDINKVKSISKLLLKWINDHGKISEE